VGRPEPVGGLQPRVHTQGTDLIRSVFEPLFPAENHFPQNIHLKLLQPISRKICFPGEKDPENRFLWYFIQYLGR
jgi:hypothetical protein